MSLFRTEVLEQRRDRLHGEVVFTQPLSKKLFAGALFGIVALAAVWVSIGTYARIETVPGIVVTGSTGGTGGSFSGGLGGIGGIGTSGGGSEFLPVVLTPEELEELDDILNPEPDPDPAPVDLDDQLVGSPSSPPSVPSESVRTLPGIDIGDGIEVFPVITGPLFDPTRGGIGIRVEIP